MKLVLTLGVLLSLSLANAASYSCRPAGARDITEAARVDVVVKSGGDVQQSVALLFPRPTTKDRFKVKLYDAVFCPANATQPAGNPPDLKCITTADKVHKKQGITAFRNEVWLGADHKTPVKVKVSSVNNKGVTSELATFDKCEELIRHHD